MSLHNSCKHFSTSACLNNTSYELVLLKYTKALIIRLKHKEDDYIGGTNWSTKESDEEPGMLTDVKKKQNRHDPRVQMGDSDRLVDLRKGTAAFVRLHPLSQ